MKKITPGQRRAQSLLLRPQRRTNNIFNQGELGPARTEADRLNAEELDLLPPISKLAISILAVVSFTALSLLTTYF